MVSSSLHPSPGYPVGDNTFSCFQGPNEYRYKAEWASHVNKYVILRNGDEHAWFFQRPFNCIVRKQQMADIIWSGILQCLISNHVLNLFREEGLTGFEVHPADVRLMFPHDPKEAVFWQLTVTGWGGMAGPSSGIRTISHATRSDVYSHCTRPAAIIDQKQWDGSDFFIVWPIPNYWWVSSRVAALLKRNKLKRCRLVSPQDLEFSMPVGSRVRTGTTSTILY